MPQKICANNQPTTREYKLAALHQSKPQNDNRTMEDDDAPQNHWPNLKKRKTKGLIGRRLKPTLKKSVHKKESDASLSNHDDRQSSGKECLNKNHQLEDKHHDEEDEEEEHDFDDEEQDFDDKEEKEDLVDDIDTSTIDNMECFVAEATGASPALMENATRVAIAVIFLRVFNGMPDPNDWKKYRIRPKIRAALGLGAKTKIDAVLHAIVASRQMNITYVAKRNPENRGGTKPSISIDSAEAQIIADCLENGFSIHQTKEHVNRYRQVNNLPSVTYSPIKNCLMRMKPMVNRIGRRAQGSDDINSAWCRARNNWDTQILIRFGKLKGAELEYLKKDGSLPDYFNPEKFPKIEVDQVVWWDETHKKCTIGGQGKNKETYVRFPRDEHGKLDLETGRYDLKPVVILNVKYEKEIRLCLGTAVMPDMDDSPMGVKADPLDYSGKMVKPIWFIEKIQDQLKEMARQSKGNGPFVTCFREKNAIYEQDDVTVIRLLATATKEKLSRFGITTVAQVKNLSDETILGIAHAQDKSHRIPSNNLIKF